MDILIILNLIFSVIALVGVGYLIFKPKAQGGSDNESIKKSVREAIGELSTMLTNSISSTNSSLTTSIKEQVERVEKEINAIKEANSASHLKIQGTISDNHIKLLEANTKGLEGIRTQNAEKLEAIQKAVGEKLEAIQKAVDEKLDNTLTTRLKASFDNVINQIGAVNTAVGEIKGLAKDVSSLNRVLTNVKTKGIVGEIALANIIEETLTPSQYEVNKVTKPNSSDPVEFAIKMPNGDDSFIYMPIDAKFPLKPYQDMKDAQDKLDKDAYESAKKELRKEFKAFAKKIRDKYIEPPYTTDFAIMFLPIEGLYVEALDMGLFEELQREYKINIAGPSTLTALLNALQVGFKSLAIQKRSAQVFDLLSAVKTEFKTFGEVLAKAQKKFGEANDEIERLVGVRTRKINSKLKEITELPDLEAAKIIDGEIDEE